MKRGEKNEGEQRGGRALAWPSYSRGAVGVGTAEAEDEAALPSLGAAPGHCCMGLSRCRCWQEPVEHQEAKCSKVESSGEDPQSYYFPGQFAFLKADG